MKQLEDNTGSWLYGPPLATAKFQFSPSIDWSQYPFSLSLIKNLNEIEFPTGVTFFVGENGTGKSTILEAIAHQAGFGAEGGSKNINFKTSEEKHYQGTQLLAEHCTLSWRRKPKNGYFFRAESFYNLANHIDAIAQFDQTIYLSYGGKSLHSQSHGESFLAFFQNRLGNAGFFIFDEPEAALSPQRQLALLSIMQDMGKSIDAQFIIATHSPILLAFPQATIYSCDGNKIMPISYTETEHYKITHQFLQNPERYMNYLFEE